MSKGRKSKSNSPAPKASQKAINQPVQEKAPEETSLFSTMALNVNGQVKDGRDSFGQYQSPGNKGSSLKGSPIPQQSTLDSQVNQN